MIKDLYPIIILAGGLATRLRPLTENMPKSLIDINGISFIEHQLKLLALKGFREVIICIGYLGEQIMNKIGDGKQFGLAVCYSNDGEQLLGTAGAIRKAFPFVSDQFFVLYGDSYLPCDYRAVQQAYIQQKLPAMMTVYKNHNQWDKSNIEFNQGKIRVYNKIHRTERMQYIDYGLSVMNKSAFSDVPGNTCYDLAALYQHLLNTDQLAAYEVHERFYENGSHHGITELSEYLRINHGLHQAVSCGNTEHH